MTLGPFDLVTFVGFIAVVVVVSLYAARKEDTGEDYFLAGRKLTWPLIGFSLVASNISTEHFVGMAGAAFGRVGLAIASYEWMAAITLVIVAWWLLPKFLRSGIYTMPEFLEYRYTSTTRTIMATYLMALYVVALLATVLYSGAQGLNGVFGFPDMLVERYGMTPENAVYWSTVGGAWCIGILAGIYTIYGGLKAVVWSDLLQGGALIFGGALVLYMGLKLCGGGTVGDDGGVIGGSVLEGWSNFKAQNAEKLHTILPKDDPELPWVAIFVGGMWIPNLFYWGMNQFITQRTLGAKSLSEGQKGIFLCCAFKLIMPFIIVFPGIIAYQLFHDEIMAKAAGDVSKAGEMAYPFLIATIMPPMLRGIMLAALAGAVMSTFNSGINSASTIFTIDIYSKHINPGADTRKQLSVGRIATAVIAILACLMAPLPGSFQGVFSYIQEIWGFISPGIVAAFLVGLVLKRAPSASGTVALVLGPILYAATRIPKWTLEAQGYTMVRAEDGSKAVAVVAEGGSEVVTGFVASYYEFCSRAFLDHMAIVFSILIVVMAIMTMVKPRLEPVVYPTSNIDVTVPKSSYVYGTLIILATIGLYVMFA